MASGRSFLRPFGYQTFGRFELQSSQLKIGVSTNSTGFFTYFLEGYIDPVPDDTVDGLMYRQTSLNNCSIDGISFYQPLSDYFGFGVSNTIVLFNSRLLLSATQQTNNGWP